VQTLRGFIERLLALRAFRFLVVGSLATATDFLIFNIAIRGVADPSRGRLLLANTAAFACATVVGYLLNSRLTFGARPDRRSLIRYVIVAILGIALYDGALLGLVRITGAEGFVGLNAVKLVAVAVSATWNFIGFTFFVFRDPEPEIVAAPQEARL
jgi:putative flippase GtrA